MGRARSSFQILALVGDEETPVAYAASTRRAQVERQAAKLPPTARTAWLLEIQNDQVVSATSIARPIPTAQEVPK